MTSDPVLLFGLFLSALSSATILPGSSEAVLLALLAKGLDGIELWVVATIGNVLGSMISWWMGTAVLLIADRRWFPVKPAALAKAQGWFNRFGQPLLLLTWLPGIGDAIAVAAGTLRVPLVPFVILVAIGKGVRYALILGGGAWLGLQGRWH